jgi:hypothetical protein
MSKGDYKDGCVDLGKSLFEFILYEGIYVVKYRCSLTCFVRGLVGLSIAISTPVPPEMRPYRRRKWFTKLTRPRRQGLNADGLQDS